MSGPPLPTQKGTTISINREAALVLVGLTGLSIHSLDETLAFGAPSGPPWPVIIVINVLFITLAVLHPRLGRLRIVPAAMFALLGAVVVSTGWTAHVQPLLGRGPGPADATGVVFMTGGGLLLISAVLLVQRAFTTAGGAPRPA